MPPTDRWQRILAAEPDDAGTWLPLPGIPRSVLVAFVAGPGKVRGNVVRPGSWQVRVGTRIGDGAPVRSTRPLSEDDIADMLQFDTSYLEALGLEPPPDLYRWSVLVPDAIEAEVFERAVGEASNDTPPGLDPLAEMRAS